MKIKSILTIFCLFVGLTACQSPVYEGNAELNVYFQKPQHAPVVRSYEHYIKLFPTQIKRCIMQAVHYSKADTVTGKVNPEQDYFYTIESGYTYIGSDNQNEYTNTDDELYNWLHTNITTEVTYEHIQTNLKGETAQLLNYYFDRLYSKSTITQAIEMTYRYFVDDEHDVLSLVIRRGSANLFYYSMRREVFNIDLRTNKLMTNEEIIERYELDKEKTQQLVYDQLDALGFRFCSTEIVDACEVDKDDSIHDICYTDCYMTDENLTSYFRKVFNAQLDGGGLFVTDEGKLRMIIEIAHPQLQLPGVDQVYFALVDLM